MGRIAIRLTFVILILPLHLLNLLLNLLEFLHDLVVVVGCYGVDEDGVDEGHADDATFSSSVPTPTSSRA